LSAALILVVAAAVVTIALKSVGPLALGSHPLPAAADRVLKLLAPALLAALVMTQTFSGGQRLVLDARAAGVAAAVVCVLLRAPLLATVVVAAVVTAGLRAFNV
jgi:branched-subunit amino acid transport protein